MEEKINSRITIRLSEETLYRVDEFMRVNDIENKSEFFRTAIEYFMERHRNMISPEKMRFSEICIDLPQRAALAMEYLDDMGYVKVSTLNGVLEEKATEWINEKARNFVGKSMDEVIDDIAKKKRMESEVMDIVRK